MKKVRDAILFPLLVAIFLWIANQGWCRLAVSREFNALCNAEVKAEIHNSSSIFRSSQVFEIEPYLKSPIRQTFVGLIAEGHYELKAGEGKRDFTCYCSCGVFQPKTSVAIQ